jgi:NAD dependent epimerase/dehydratase family enzyme
VVGFATTSACDSEGIKSMDDDTLMALMYAASQQHDWEEFLRRFEEAKTRVAALRQGQTDATIDAIGAANRR